MLKSTFLASRSPLFVFVAASALGACNSPKLATGTYSSGSLALSVDGKTLYVADDDNNQLLVVNPETQVVTARVNVGTQPAGLVAASNGNVFVSNRQSRSVSVVNPNSASVVGTIAVGAEPTGLALSADEKTLVVANTTNSNVSIVDVPSLTVRATVATDPDPNGVTIISNSEAWVTHIREGAITRIDLAVGHEKVITSFSLSAPTAATGGNNMLPGQPVAPVVAGDSRLYVVHSQSLDQAIATTPTSQLATPQQSPSSGNSYASVGGGTGALPTAIVAGAIATIDIPSHSLLLGADATANVQGFNGGVEGAPVPSNGITLTPSVSGSMPNLPAGLPAVGSTDIQAGVPPFLMTVANQPLSGPSAAVVDATGSFLFVANKNSNNVAIVQTSPAAPNGSGSSQGIPTPPTFNGPTNNTVTGPAQLGFGMQQVVSVGAGPTGIAIPGSNDRVYVYNSFDHTVSVITANGGKTADVEAARFSVGTSPLTPAQDTGRRLFFSAIDPRMTNNAAGGIACASCHPSGRDDGRTWTFTEGPRNTPMLAGRDLLNTAPYHWDGLIADMPGFNSVITNRMGGAGDGTSANGPASDGSVLAPSDFQALQVFLDSQPSPDNPFVQANDPASVQRGAALFASTAVGCTSCHSGVDFTDNLLHNVGTMINFTPADQNANAEQQFFTGSSAGPAVNTPSLRNIFASAPYLHDGSAADLMARIIGPDAQTGLHGNTIQLSDQQKADLVAFLQTI